MRRLVLPVFLVLLFSPLQLVAGQKWGKVDIETLTMDFVPEDPEAHAVVLFDIGRITVTNKFDQVFERHRRVKILTEEGKEYADVSIPFWKNDKFKRFDAHTILPSGKKVKLDKDDIFEEKAGGRREKKFAFPAVEVGAVIEYRFEIFSESIRDLEPWYFQNSEFTKLSKLSVSLPKGMHYLAFFKGARGDDPEPVRSEFANVSTGKKKHVMFTWEMEDLEAVREEPRMMNVRDHMLSLFFQYESYVGQRATYSFIRTWEDLAEEMNDYYRLLMEEDEGLKEKSHSLIEGRESDIEKARAIYYYVKDEIEEASIGNVLKIEKLHEVVEKQKGNRVAKNILLMNLLKHAGLDASPVLISTTDHGAFREDWVRLNQFNHAIAYLKIGNKNYLLDTADKYCPFGTLPKRDLAGMGFRLDGEESEIIDIPMPKEPSRIKGSTTSTVTEDGDLVCHSEINYSGYYGISQRKVLDEMTEDEYIEELVNEQFGDVEVESFGLTGLDNLEEPFVVSVEFRLPAYAQVVGNLIYLSPPLFLGVESNPFKREKRKYPIEYSFRSATEEVVKLSIPEGFQVVEAPRSWYDSQLGGLFFTSSCERGSNSITYRRKYERKKLTIYPKDYATLRDFFAHCAESDQGQIVLSR